MNNQRTIKKEKSVKGRGIHTGRNATVTLKPASPNTGILFKRVDVANSPIIRAQTDYILDGDKSPRQTSIAYHGVQIQTVEHLMAALAGLSIDNILIEIDNSEIPALDGSALEFVKVIKEAGIEELDVKKKEYVLKEAVWAEEGDSLICALPAPVFSISYTFHNDSNSFLRTRYCNIVFNQEVFERDICPSRTFVLKDESDRLLEKGLGKGADHENTLVISDKGVIDNTLRFEDEFMRHKVLDLIGDLYLLGRHLCAHVIAIKTGHYLNHQLLKKIQRQFEKERKAAFYAAPLGHVHGGELDIDLIKRILPHRYPFLLVDKIIELEKGKRAVGIKNVTANEEFFNGHFPNRPVMPGVLIIEAMAQVGGVLMLSPEEHRGKLAFFMSMNNVKFRKTVVPGDQVILEVRVGKIRSRAGQLFTQASVDGEIVAEAELMFALVNE